MEWILVLLLTYNGQVEVRAVTTSPSFEACKTAAMIVNHRYGPLTRDEGVIKQFYADCFLEGDPMLTTTEN